jgi:hypothetical protein
VDIPENWFANERGNTWLMDDDGNHVMWVNVNDKVRMEISICPNDYPGLNICILSEAESTDEHLAKHIHEKCVGWYARKCNIEGVVVDSDDTIALTFDESET